MATTSLEGKTAFVTGGANGIGLGIAKALINRGARVMLADVNEEGLIKVASTMGNQVDTVVCDVADAGAVQDAAAKTEDRFGKVHILVNNAGVGAGGAPGEIPMKDWNWVVGINLMGVIHGVETFVPMIKSHGEGGHIINTASMAGHFAGAGTGAPYNATKFAVVGYSETLRAELLEDNIGVSVLCPGWVNTDIHKSGFRKPSGVPDVEAAMADPQFQMMDAVLKGGLSPDVVGEWTAECMEANRMYVFTHPDMRPAIEMRHKLIAEDYDACEADPRFNGDG